MRCGGSWKRSYGTTYTGTKGETPNTDKVGPSELPRQISTLPAYVVHYHTERNHQGVGNRLLEPLAKVGSTNDLVHCRERLGGMLNYYYREVA